MMEGYYDERANWSLIPEHMRHPLYEYVMNGGYVGNFLDSLLSGGAFLDVVANADSDNQQSLMGWAMFLFNHVPGSCHRSPERVKAWQEKGGMNGRKNKEAEGGAAPD